MLVDPRPYTYEFRKPRYSNPTFQSRNLYESLYHRLPQASNDYFPQPLHAQTPKPHLSPEPTRYPEAKQYRQLERNLSDVRSNNRPQEIYHQNTPRDNNREYNPNPERKVDAYKLPSISHNMERARADTNIGTEIMARRQEPRKQGRRIEGADRAFERFRIYERQQKPFNIISCYPKENESNKLRNFPKLTLEDKLIERGSYHSFNQNPL